MAGGRTKIREGPRTTTVNCKRQKTKTKSI
jgi:hypothetical protein